MNRNRAALVDTIARKYKNTTMGALLLITALVVLPTSLKIINLHFNHPGQEFPVVSRVSSFTSAADPAGEFLVPGNLWLPDNASFPYPRPAIVACHGFIGGIGKESMGRWALELAKRGFIVYAIDLPGNGMTTNTYATALPRADFEAVVVGEAVTHLRGMSAVNSSAVGLIGISYGGTTVALSAGVLGDQVNATVCLNGFTNATRWLIDEQGILRTLGIEFTVTPDRITLAGCTERQVQQVYELFAWWRGSSTPLEGLVVPGTTALNRSFLRRFDAVEFLPAARDGSVMFIHSLQDEYFAVTNQSGLGYDAIRSAGKTATFIPVNDTHQMFDDPAHVADYCYINFFEERLLGVPVAENLTGTPTPLEKYAQHRDIHLTFAPEWGTSLFVEVAVVFLLSLLPILGIFNVVLYNKRHYPRQAPAGEPAKPTTGGETTQDRAVESPDQPATSAPAGDADEIGTSQAQDPKTKEADPGEGLAQSPFPPSSRGVFYARSLLLVVGIVVVAFVAEAYVGVGIFTNFINGTLLASVVVMTLVFFYTYPHAKDAGTPGAKPPAGPPEPTMARLKAHKRELATALALVFGAGGAGLVAGVLPNGFHRPFEALFRALLVTGVGLVIGALAFARVRQARDQTLSWQAFNLDPGTIARASLFGLVLVSVVVMEWNAMALYQAFPYANAPRSVYFLYGASACLAFGFGLEMWTSGVLRHYTTGGRSFKELTWQDRGLHLAVVLLVGFGVSLVALAGVLGPSLLAAYLPLVALLVAVLFPLSDGFKLLCAERHFAFKTIFLALVLFWGASIFLHV